MKNLLVNNLYAHPIPTVPTNPIFHPVNITCPVINEMDRKPIPNPTSEDLNNPFFEAIWQVIKNWDINVPEYYHGYCGGNGSHVKLILDAIMNTPIGKK